MTTQRATSGRERSSSASRFRKAAHAAKCVETWDGLVQLPSSLVDQTDMFLRRESVPDLLNVLDAAVIRGGAAGFEGRVAFGVEISPDRALWWVAELGAAPTTSFTTELPFDADAGAIMGLNEADALLGRGERQTDHFATFGSVELLQRTMERYLKHRSPIDARASGSAPPTRRRKNGRSAR